jgi:two-component system chemotaxis response regulator CheY
VAKVLVVDDSAMSRRVLRKILESGGHDVEEAADGISAVETYFLNRPDLVMLDLIMHGMNGLDVLATVRKMDPNSCIVVASADIQLMTRELAYKEGALGFVNKPYIPEEILRTVSSVLEARAK